MPCHTSLTSCVYAWGGLLRKPPLKCGRTWRVARITYGYAHLTRIRTGALTYGQCAYLPAHYAQGLRIRARSSHVREATCSSTVWSTSSGLGSQSGLHHSACTLWLCVSSQLVHNSGPLCGTYCVGRLTLPLCGCNAPHEAHICHYTYGIAREKVPIP